VLAATSAVWGDIASHYIREGSGNKEKEVVQGQITGYVGVSETDDRGRGETGVWRVGGTSHDDAFMSLLRLRVFRLLDLVHHHLENIYWCVREGVCVRICV
jgi:hypothetical protein